ncbi:MAG: FkbM family methyltransferase [Chloroflexi bacterium]|nr:FkbM family methyltransferase [Chloroflexota bacterium]
MNILENNRIEQFLTTPITGIIQAGGHIGQEVPLFLRYSDKIIIFEPQKDAYKLLAEKCKNTPVVHVNLALGSSPAEGAKMFKDNWEQMSSSLLKPKLHLLQYPMITFNDTEYVSVTTIDQFFVDLTFPYNMLVLDTQGFELEILRGARGRMSRIDYVLCEVSLIELYQDCPLIDEIDSFLYSFGFERLELTLEGGTWGEAFYRRIPVI